MSTEDVWEKMRRVALAKAEEIVAARKAAQEATASPVPTEPALESAASPDASSAVEPVLVTPDQQKTVLFSGEAERELEITAALREQKEYWIGKITEAKTQKDSHPEPAVEKGTNDRREAILKILSEVENPSVAQAILDGMDLIRDGLHKAAHDFYQGDETELARHKKQITDHIRMELNGFLSNWAFDQFSYEGVSILERYLGEDGASKKEEDEQTGIITEMAVERFDKKGEDASFLLPEKNAFGVFDGVSAGEAARAGAEFSAADLSAGFGSQSADLKDAITAGAFIRKSLREVHKTLQSREGCWTTATVGCIIEEADGRKKLMVGNVGDSRMYIFQKGKLRQITLDDSASRATLNESQARERQSKLSSILSRADYEWLSAEERYAFDHRYSIGQIVGHPDVVLDPHIYVENVSAGDIVFASSDGIHDPLADPEMEEILRENEGKAPSEIASVFIEATRKRNEETQDGKPHVRSKTDDMTILIVKVK